MPVDHIRYDVLAQQALRGLVRTVLQDTARKGLPGEHHFFISFDTRAEGVRLSPRLREQYPEEMTIVMQHQFWDLKVGDDSFEVGLSFGGVGERLTVPFSAVKSFVDPSVQFALQFEPITDKAAPATKTKTAKPDDKPSEKPKVQRARAGATRTVPSIPAPAAPAGSLSAPAAGKAEKSEKPDKSEKPEKSGRSAEVVRLDRFRKK